MLRIALLSLVCLIGLLPVAAHAQDVSERRISATPACRQCRIEITRGPLLGTLDDEELLSELINEVAPWRGGRFLVVGAPQQDGVFVYGADGRLESIIGRRGRGPGELMNVRGVEVFPGDSVLIVQLDRVTLFDPAGRYARSAPLTGVRAAHALRTGPNGRTLYASWLRTPAGSGFQFHLFGPEFDLLRSIVPVPPQVQATCTRCAIHSVAWSAARPGHFWSLAPNHYSISRWREDGTLVERLVVESPWFVAWHADPPRPQQGDRVLSMGMTTTSTAPPLPTLSRITEDDRGLLWVTAHVVNRRWTPPPPLPGLGMPRDADLMARRRENFRRSLDTIIQVIDPMQGILVASHRVEADALVAIGPGLYWTKEEDPRTGIFRIQIWHVRLSGR